VYNVLANAIILTHFLFIAFVVCGGLLVVRWPRIAFVHLPAAVWGAVVEIFGWICPLTPLENHFRLLAGYNSYGGDFIVRYLIPVIYPENLTITIQQILGVLVIFINIIFYTIAIRKQRSRKYINNKKTGLPG
jgi:drug/metabolite transporter superfamily protein YnfA